VSASISLSATASDSFTVRAPWPGHEAGVPERIPEALGQRADDRDRFAAADVVHEEHVDVGSRAKLAPTVRAERDDRDRLGTVERGERVDQRLVDGVRERDTEGTASQRAVKHARVPRVA